MRVLGEEEDRRSEEDSVMSLKRGGRKEGGGRWTDSGSLSGGVRLEEKRIGQVDES